MILKEAATGLGGVSRETGGESTWGEKSGKLAPQREKETRLTADARSERATLLARRGRRTYAKRDRGRRRIREALGGGHRVEGGSPPKMIIRSSASRDPFLRHFSVRALERPVQFPSSSFLLSLGRKDAGTCHPL